jgi:hypothetical protein
MTFSEYRSNYWEYQESQQYTAEVSNDTKLVSVESNDDEKKKN